MMREHYISHQYNHILKNNTYFIISQQNHAWFAERCIITVKLMLYNIIDHGKVDNPQWIDFVYIILLTYTNKMVHSSIKMTPYEATNNSNAIDVKNTIECQASFTRRYPELNNREQC